MRRPLGGAECVPGEAERRGVGKVMTRVREQRQAVAEPSEQRFGGHERQRQRDGAGQRPAGHVGRGVAMAMAVAMRVRVPVMIVLMCHRAPPALIA